MGKYKRIFTIVVDSLGLGALPDAEGLTNTEIFAVVGATIAENFGVAMPEGTIGSFLYEKLI